ncbi:SulP family inorganic anion transporter [Gallionella capsiferriformans]|uniref:Sulphate transporter n=1 Tax=Gallionella capsiferriformans (strain ES-2) TaxID=395494 RepID=D9SE38_GALCS|nr:SulP family inorganic anion transporter [Gallionella capsiferriformans]ADL56860.1 sulphate transporter [Gallionella capsiferriformans ES-2]
MSTLSDKLKVPGDFWGGLASTLVALPAAVAFGVTIYSAISPQYAVFGALAGILGATALGLIASTFGGTDRLISAPCAPAAAVLSAFAIELVNQGVAPASIVLMLTVLGILTGLIQILIGFLGVGRLIRYIPYTVVSGYLSGVGLIIIGSQIPRFVGTSANTAWWRAAVNPALWDTRSIAIGAATVLVALLAPKITKAIPSTILGITAGIIAYFVLANTDATMMTLTDNPLVLGSLGASSEGYIGTIIGRWYDIGELKLSQVAALFGSALTLAALLSIDTLKTCVVIDQMTRTRHDPNRELFAQGLANIASSAIGGIPGAGIMGPTMVNLSSGAQTRVSGIIEGLLVLIVALVLSNFIAWIPVATLAGILIVIGLRMIDTKPLNFLESRATVFDFAVVAVVIGFALTVGLIAASAAGVALSILLFLREQVGGSVIRHKTFVSQRSSTWYRPEAEMRLIAQKGDKAVIFELQGSLFFGTTYELYSVLEAEIKTRDYIILDLRRVLSVDITAAHMLNQVRDMMRDRGMPLLMSNVREHLPNGNNLLEFFKQTELIDATDAVRVFQTIESAIEWVEHKLIGDIELPVETEVALNLQEMNLFQGRKVETLTDLEARMEQRTVKAGDSIYSIGDQERELYLIRRGVVRILAPIGGSRQLHHIATFGRGDFFGGLAFLDDHARGDNAIAHTDIDLFVLPLEQFNQLAEDHKKLAFLLITAISRTLAHRLRHADGERTMLHV